jgi:hypothetical protein
MMNENLDHALALSAETRFTYAEDIFTSENFYRISPTFSAVSPLAKDYGETSDPSTTLKQFYLDTHKLYKAKHFTEELIDCQIYPLSKETKGPILQIFSGIHLLSNLKLKHSKAVQLRGLGKCRSNNEDFLLLAFASIKGKNAEDFLYLAFENNPYTKAIEIAHSLANKLGLAIGELHAQKSTSEMSWPDSLVNHYESLLENSFEMAALFPEIDVQLINAFFHNSLQLARTAKYTPSLSNNFASLSAYSYSESKNELCQKEVQNIHFSVDRFHKPIGSPSLEFASFEQSLAMILSANNCKTEDSTDIILTWKKAYLSTAATLPPEDQTPFVTFMFILVSLKKTIAANAHCIPNKTDNYFREVQYLRSELTKIISSFPTMISKT